MPRKVVLKDKLGHNFNGELYADEWGKPIIVINGENIIGTYTYRRFAIVRLTYKAKGNFLMFVPESTHYFLFHPPIPGLLNYEVDTINHDHQFEFDSIGMYDSNAARNKKRGIRFRDTVETNYVHNSGDDNEDNLEFDYEESDDNTNDYVPHKLVKFKVEVLNEYSESSSDCNSTT